jgi:hypothetical protein
MANTTISTSIGTNVVNNAVVPYMRSREIEFGADNLRPDRLAQFFFGDTNVTRFVQRASRLLPDIANAAVATAGVLVGERFYCNTTHGFATAIGKSMSNTIYLNENYTTVNVAAIGANTLGVSDYAVGDVVYQAVGNVVPTPDNATFEGRVFYWNSSDGVMAIEPITGTLTVNSSANIQATIYKSGSALTVRAASLVQGNRFPLNSIVSSLDNVSKRFLVNTYDHRHGSVGGVNPPNANCVIVSGTVPSDAVGNIVFITGQTGLGQAGLVLAVNGNAVYTNTTFNPYPTGNSYYSLGLNSVDDSGHLFGVFNLPETSTVQFLTGSQKFTISDSNIVDDPNATMMADAQYVSQGYLGAGKSTPATPVVSPITTQPSIAPPINQPGPSSSQYVSTPQTALASPGPNTTYSGVLSQLAANSSANGIYNGVDLSQLGGTFSVNPIAQTFFTPPPKSQKSNYGIFVSSIDIWFNAKPVGSSPQFPVQLKIVQVQNGYPTQNVVASCSVDYGSIQVSTTPDSINIGSSIINNTTSTKFKFLDPVYLQPSTEYAIVLYTENPDYEVYIANVGSNDISNGGNGIRRISSQPSVGSFFKSQNASTWTAVPNEALMFVLNKAVFSTAPVSFNFVMQPLTSLTPYDSLLLHSSDLNFPPCQLTYKVLTTLANTFAQEPGYTQVLVDTPWNFGHDLKVSSINSTRRRVIIPGNNQSLLCQVSMQTNDPDVSPMFNGELLSAIATTNIINSGQINPENITVTNGGNHINANNIIVTISPPDLADGVQATANVMVMSGNSVSFITVINPGAGYSVSPTITISEAGAPVNATAVVSGENGQIGGNGITRYVTRKITLANGFAAGDLRVYLNAIRPVGSDVCVYYKALSSTDTQSFTDLPWVKMTLINDVNSADQNTPVGLQFCPALGSNGLPSGVLQYTVNGVQYPLGGSFQYFAIKIVLFADDQTVVPTVSSLQVTALPAG